MPTELLAQVGRVQFCTWLRAKIGDQSGVAGAVFTGNHHGFADAAALYQVRFDFTQFNTETAQFDLEVVTAQIVDITVGQPAAEVARFVEASIRSIGKWIGNKTLCCQFRTIKIAACDTRAANIDFTGDTKGNGLFLLIQNVDLCIGNRATNRRCSIMACIAARQGGTDGNFRWTVSIKHSSA
ncbi:hypothetical protein PB72LOC_03351 [Pectobacterium atrosepticum]|nr:hypothetical protein PB72LOC_03351 [Pectobacterium atrosepticum]